MDINGTMKTYKIKIKNPVMGVPITFLDKYCKDQFEIIGYACNGSNNQFDYCKPIINGKNIYKRLLIKRR